MIVRRDDREGAVVAYGAFAEVGQAAGTCGVGHADAVVLDLHLEAVAGPDHRQPEDVGVGVAGRVVRAF